MADKTILGSLIITAEVNGGPFAAAMQRLSATTVTQAATMRKHLDTTSASVEKLTKGAGSNSTSFRPYAFLALSRAMADTNARANLLRSTFLGLAATVGGFTGALAANAIIAYADTYTELQNRLRLVTKSTAELNAVQDMIFQSTIQTGVGIKDAVDAYEELSTAANRLHLSQSQLVRVNESLSKLFRLSGADPRAAAQATTQIAVGIASNNIQGQQLRPILKNQEIAKTLADQISGGSVAALRRMATEGQLSAGKIVKAMINAGDEIDRKFASLAPTISNSIKDLDNAMTLFIGRQDTALGASRMLANGLELLARNIDKVGGAVILLGEFFLVNFATRGIGGAIGKLTTFTTLMRQGAAAAVVETAALKDTALAAQLAAAARLKEAEAAALAVRAPGSFTFGATQTQALATAERELLAARVAMPAVTKTAEAATAAYAAATIVAQRATIGATVATKLWGGAMAILGGPVNAAITVAIIGFSLLAARQEDAARAAAIHENALTDLTSRLITAKGKSDDLNKSLRDGAVQAAALDLAKAQNEFDKAAAEYMSIDIENARGSGDIGKGIRALGEMALSLVAKGNLDEAATKLHEASKNLTSVKDAIKSFDEAGTAGTIDTTAEATKKFTDEMLRLRLEAAAGPLTEFQKSVVDTARTAGIGEAAITKYINAAKAGKGGMVGGTVGEIRDLQTQIAAWGEYKSLLSVIGPTAAMVSEKQAALNVLVKAGAITADQAKTAFGDYLTSFQNYKWIDDLTAATDEFATSAIQDFHSVGDAFSTLLKKMATMALQELALKPFDNFLKAILGGGIGNLFGGGGGLGNVAMGALYHDGTGSVGKGSPPMRAVSASVFKGAPRYANGMGPNEFSAILHRGEQVLTEQETARSKRVMSGMSGRGWGGGAPSIVYSPTYHAPGASAEAVQALAGVMAEDKRNFTRDIGRVVGELFSRGSFH